MQKLSILLRRTYGAYAPQITIVSILAFINSIVEGVGISAIIPFFSLLNGGAHGDDPITRLITALLGSVGVALSLRSLLVFVGVLFIAKTVVLFLIQYINAQIVFSYERNLRSDLLGDTLASGWSFLSEQKVGYLDQLLITNTTNASQFFYFSANFVMMTSKLLTFAVIALNLSPLVTLLALGLGGGAFFVFKPLFYRNRVISSEEPAASNVVFRLFKMNSVCSSMSEP